MSEEILSLIENKLAEHTRSQSEEIKVIIEETVNGGVRAVKKQVEEMDVKLDNQIEMNRQHNEKHEADMVLVRDNIEKTRPIVEAYSGGKILGEGLKWLAGVAAAWLVLKQFWTN